MEAQDPIIEDKVGRYLGLHGSGFKEAGPAVPAQAPGLLWFVILGLVGILYYSQEGVVERHSRYCRQNFTPSKRNDQTFKSMSKPNQNSVPNFGGIALDRSDIWLSRPDLPTGCRP